MEIKMHLDHTVANKSSLGSECSLDGHITNTTGTSWRKSSFSTYNGNCVEIGHLDSGVIGIRDTGQHGIGPVLAVKKDEWSAFLYSVKAGKSGVA
jgi:Domain of unknown function (DUF397)